MILDFENAGLAEPEYELRGFPGPGMGPGVELLTATMRHYERLTGRVLSAERIMAWHARQALGDVLWRSEAGLSLTDSRSPSAWVDDIAARFRELSISIGLLCVMDNHHDAPSLVQGSWLQSPRRCINIRLGRPSDRTATWTAERSSPRRLSDNRAVPPRYGR